MSNKFQFPFRVGRKQKRAVLDAHGREVVVFPKGCEDMAIEFATFKNTMEAQSLKVMNEMKVPNPIPFPLPLIERKPPNVTRLNRDFLDKFIEQGQ